MCLKDDVLVRRTLCGDKSAFALLVERYQGVVYRIAYGEIGNHHDAEDIAQEAFLKAYCKLKALKDPNTFPSWLYAITANLCKSWWRKQRMEATKLTRAAPLAPAAWQLHEQQEQKAALWDSVDELASKDREIMTMFYREGYSTKEIGEKMGITQNQVLVRLHRARKQLREEFIMVRKIYTLGESQPTFIEQVMGRIHSLEPTPAPGSRPLVPWIAAATLAVIALLAGIGVMQIPWFQSSHNLTRDEPAVKVELTGTPILKMPLTKRMAIKRTGLSGNDGGGNRSDGSVSAFTSDSRKGEDTKETGWTQTNGPYGGIVLALLATPEGTLYAGTQGAGIFRSSDGGNSWTPVNSGLGIYEDHRIPTVFSLAIMGDTLYAGTGGDIFRSVDGSNSWEQITWLRSKGVGALAVIGNTLYAGRAEDGILRSKDGGDSWMEVNRGLADLRIRRLAVMGTALYAGTKDGVFRLSGDIVGDTWIPVNAGLTAPRSDPEAIEKAMAKSGAPPVPISKFMIDRRVDSFAVSGETLYMGMVNGLFRSADRGKSWTQIGSESMRRSISALAVSGATLYAGGGGVFCSTDGGDSWAEVNTGLTNHLIHSLLAVEDTLYAGTSGGGVFRLVRGEDSWIEINSGLANTTIDNLVFFGKALYGSTNRSIARSLDGGESWTSINTGLMTPRGFPHVCALVVSGPKLYVATSQARDGGVFRLEDGGNLWVEVTPKLTGIRSLAVKGTTFYAGTSGDGIFRLGSGDDSWTCLGVLNQCIESLAVSGTKIFAGTAKGDIFRSMDGGKSWIEVSEGLTNRGILDLALVETTLYAGTFGDGVFRSMDDGDSWTPINEGLTDTTITVLSVTGATLYAGTHYHGVFRLERDEDLWKPVGSMHRDIRSLVASGDTLYAGTMEEGVFRISLPR